MMKAVLVKEPGGPEQLYIGDTEKPKPTADSILVKVKATALNRADTLQRKGKYPPPKGDSLILGLEASGIVEEVGANFEKKFKKGDHVFSLVGGGGYGEYCLFEGGTTLLLPPHFDFVTAAAIPEAFLTAYQSVHWHAKLQEGETILIHAGASGVGTAAIQLAKLKKCNIIVTVGSEEKAKFCKELGATHAINYKEKNGQFLDDVLSLTNQKGVNVIIDFIGGGYFQQNIRALGLDGRMVMLAFLGPPKTPSEVDLSTMLKNRIQIIGSTLRSRTNEYKAQLSQEFWKYAEDKFLSKELKPIIDRTLDWSKVAEAHTAMEANENTGKIVLTIN